MLALSSFVARSMPHRRASSPRNAAFFPANVSFDSPSRSIRCTALSPVA
jgi:hypothetical protein